MRIWISGPRLFGELIRPGISVSDRELRAFLVRRGKLVKEIAMATGLHRTIKPESSGQHIGQQFAMLAQPKNARRRTSQAHRSQIPKQGP
jgi:hypothetical protein